MFCCVMTREYDGVKTIVAACLGNKHYSGIHEKKTFAYLTFLTLKVGINRRS